MSTYVERRRVAVDEAVAAAQRSVDELAAELAATPAGPGHDALAGRLAAAERDRAAVLAEVPLWAGVEIPDAEAEAALLAWLWGPPRRPAQRIVGAVLADPVTAAAPDLALLGRAEIVASLVAPGRPQPELVGRLRDRVGAELAEQLVVVALRDRLALPEADRPGLTRDVCVLLPLRLETLFRDTGAGWTMLLRIVPDEASVRRDDPDPTPTEVTLLTAFWQAVADPGRPAAGWLAAEAAATPWATFCGQVGAARAAHLAGTYGPVPDGDRVTVAVAGVEHPDPPNRVGGFPAAVDVLVSFAGDPAPRRLATTAVDRDALVFDVVGGKAGPDGPVDQDDRWWVSWAAAQAVGLGVEVPLPAGLGPADITGVYAVGVGEENPAGHLRAQVEAGELAYLPLGAPTNAVDGAAVASLGHDAEEWRSVAARRLAGETDRELSRRLTGTGAAVPVPPPAPGVAGLDQVLVRALWPALWGHQLRDAWQFGEDADRLAAWAADHLRPEGPLPPVRIAEQPYGLLPVAGMTGWRTAVEEGGAAECEARFLEPLLALRTAAAAAARARGTAVGADTARLLDLLGHDAASAGYAYRLLLPDELLAALYASFEGADPDAFAAAARTAYEPAMELLGQEPARRYLAAGDAGPVPLPLVLPRTWPPLRGEPARVEDEVGQVAAYARLLELVADDGLLPVDRIREEWRGVLPDSLLFRLLLSAAVLAVAGVSRTNAGSGDPVLEPLLAADPQPTLLRALWQAWSAADPDDSPAGLVRRLHQDGLRTLIDLFRAAPPGLVGQVDRALRAVLDTATHRVDPWLTGMAARRLAYLSELPDTRFRLGVYGWVDGPVLGAPGPTAGGLLHAPSHAQALTAVVLRDKAVSTPDGRWSMQLDSDRIRLADELAEEVRAGAPLTEVVGRQVERVVGTTAGVAGLRRRFPVRGESAGRVCDGLAALPALLAEAPGPELAALRDALDAYGDLLVAEAVHQVVTGRADRAGAALDAAAGLAGPPSLEFVGTPLAADGLSTAVVTALPYAPPVAGLPPAGLADPSVAAALVALLGPAADWTWGALTLADLGLEPVDTLVLSADVLAALAGGPGGTGPDKQRQARDLVRALGGQPALGSDLAGGPTPELDAAVLAELTDRYDRLRAAAADTLAALGAAADPPARVAALRAALRWGITPTLDTDEQARWAAALRDGTDAPVLLPALVEQAAGVLTGRLGAAPAPGAGQPLARAIAELAAPDGALAVLGMLPVAGLRPDPDLDTGWLPVVAAVRPPLARLEAAQLAALVGAGPGFAPVSSAPGDPWQVTALAALRAARAAPGGNPRAALPRFVAGYGLGAAWAGPGPVAVGLVDSWSEAVPVPRQTTTAAFGFNAPAARPPQAILLAVPPDLAAGYGAPADTGTVLAAVLDARELAHARAVRAEDLGGLLAAVPTAVLVGTGDTGVRLTGTEV